MPLLIVILVVILGLIVVIAIINAMWRLRPVIFSSSRPHKLNEQCSTTSDCHIGLTCDQSRCLIPITGSCVNREDLCSQNGVCKKGMCVIEVDPVIKSSSPTPAKVLKPNIISKILVPVIEPKILSVEEELN